MPKQGEPLDVDELFRRLERHRQHLEEARERRRAKAEKKSASGEYHHVPQFAAADFVRTTTPDVRSAKNVHPLSRPVAQMQAPRPKSEGHMVTNQLPLSQVVQNHDLSQLNMLLNAERNQFTQSGALARAAEVDKERNIHKLPQRDFDFSRSMSMSNRTGSMCDRSNSLSNRSRTMTEGRKRPKSYLPTFNEWTIEIGDVPSMPRPHHISNHNERRHDWSQNEAVVMSNGHSDQSHCRNTKLSTPISRFFESKTQVHSKVHSLDSMTAKTKPLARRRSSFFAAFFHRRITT